MRGEIRWSELMTRDPAAAGAFLAQVAGWRVTPMDTGGGPPYHLCFNGETAVAGLYDLRNPEFGGIDPRWVSYIEVEDVDALLETVAAADGAVMRPPVDIPNVGRVLLIREPSGGVTGFIARSRD